MKNYTAYLLTGSNLGNSKLNLQNALQLIGNRAGEMVRFSSVYVTAPWGLSDQPAYLNQVIEIATNLNPEKLLKVILEIEVELGRTRTEKWKERIIDIDILFFDTQIVEKEDLKIPHPFMHLRKFTLIPLNEIAPDFIHPVFIKSISQLLSACLDDLKVEKLTD